jgi:S-adenosylmethionine:tRNA ribosyltransferase-isomerase
LDPAEFDYDLPEELIAQYPLPDRAASRMLVVHRKEGRWEDRAFRDLPQFLHAGDCLVLNDSRVLPSRLFGRRAGVHSLPVGKKNPKRREHLSGRVEVLLLRPVAGNMLEWEALVRPGRKMRTGEVLRFPEGVEAEIVARSGYGERTVRFRAADDFVEWLERVGHVPLPPYIRRPDTAEDRGRYQTIYAREPGSAAAPTAGLHFTPEVLEACRNAGAAIAYVTLHVGLGTFQPLHKEQIETGKLHPEAYVVRDEDAAIMRVASRLVAAGTTSLRTIETVVERHGRIAAARGESGIFIYPGFRFRAAGALLTNFHLPRTSLFLLVCAFAGTDLARAAYRHAIERRYRFYSYGDCMLIL